MNNADIEAARRLIDQFEGKALGRHNSNQWNRPSGEGIPEQHRQVIVKDRPEDCRVGEYCLSMGRRVSEGVMTVRMIDPQAWRSARSLCEMSDREWQELTYSAWEFERVWLCDRRWLEYRREAWRRIA